MSVRDRAFRLALVAAVLLVATTSALAQSTVTLTATAAPAAAQPGVHTVAVTGSGFPSGTIAAAAVTLTLRPASGVGAVVTATATAVAVLPGTTRRIAFVIPAALSVTAPTPYTVSVDGRTTAGTTFASGNRAAVTVNPPARIVTVTPDAVQAGTPADVVLTTEFTNFAQRATQASFGPGISVAGGAPGGFGLVTVTSATSATARIVVDPAAAGGPRTITVRTGVQQASLADALTVSPAQPANQPPVADAGINRTLTLQPGQQAIDVTLDGRASHDPDGSVVAYAWTGTPDPPDAAQPVVPLGVGVHVFTLRVTDNLDAISAPSTVSITVAQPRPPQVGVSSSAYTITQGATLTVPVTGTSPDGRVVTLSASPALPNASFVTTAGSPAGGTLTFTPAAGQSGIQAIVFSARDTLGLTDTRIVQLTIGKVNHAPTVTLAASAHVDEGRTLVVPVTAADPDGDTLTLAATGLPATNAVFVPSTGTLSFSPDFTQAGPYVITVTASDGQLSATSAITITVDDVPGGGVTGDLVLSVDAVESPSFFATQRVTGTVGTGASTPAAPSSLQALITGMSPATGLQGTTVDVVLTGDAARYLPHFAAAASQASFGAGVTVDSFTVVSPTRAEARVSIAAEAPIGPRPVTVVTAAETATSILAFNVTRGTTSVSGRVVDADTTIPIPSAIVSIQGTGLSTPTDASGQFALAGVPSGSQVVLVNAANHELLQVPVHARTGTATAIGTLTTRSTVFNPLAPSSVSQQSVMGRGLADTSGRITERDARQLVTDTWLLVGGQDAGVMDEYGNQLSDTVTGQGMISLTPHGVRALAEKVRRGDTTPLIEILYGFSYGFQWSTTPPGTGTPSVADPPTLPEWLARLQALVNEAWADPLNHDSMFAQLVFNKGRTLSPDAPILSFSTRLSALQTNLLVMSYFLYALDPQGNGTGGGPDPADLSVDSADDERRGPHAGAAGPWETWAIVSAPAGQVSPTGRSVPRQFWRKYFAQASSYPYAEAANVIGANIAATTGICAFGGLLGTVLGAEVVNVGVGQLADLLVQFVVTMNLMATVPSPPTPLTAETLLNGDGRPSVRVTFKRSTHDTNALAAVNAQQSVFYVYTLYRYDTSPYNPTTGVRAEDVPRTMVASLCSNCEVPYPGNPAAIVDPSPTPDRSQYYDMTVTRFSGDPSRGDEQTLARWVGALTSVGEDAPGSGPGLYMPLASASSTLSRSMRRVASDFSPMVMTYVSERPVSPVDEIAVDPHNGIVYFSEVARRALFRSEWQRDTYLGTSFLSDTAFAVPGQTGLAIDDGTNPSLYTDNHASDMQFGGRLFRFAPKSLPLTADNYLPHFSADRTLVGSVNYFSQLLMYANPVSVSRMAYGGVTRRRALTVIDELSGSVRELSLEPEALADPSRNIARVVAYLPNHDGPVIDLDFDSSGSLYILTRSDVFVLRPGPDPGTVAPVARHVALDAVAGRQVGGMAVDPSGNVYVAVTDPASNGGRVLMFERDRCAEPGYEPLIIMSGLDSLGDVDLSHDGRALFMVTAGGTIDRRAFGVTGTIVDPGGTPVPGATVSIETTRTPHASVKTDAQGRFLVPEVFRSDLLVPLVRITIEFGGVTQTFHTMLGQPDLTGLDSVQHGQTVRTITFATR